MVSIADLPYSLFHIDTVIRKVARRAITAPSSPRRRRALLGVLASSERTTLTNLDLMILISFRLLFAVL